MEGIARAKNVVITGIAENGDGLDANISEINDLCDSVGIPQVLIDDVFRMGKKKESTPRPILLKMALMVDKKRLMKTSKILRKKKIYLNDDLTHQERVDCGLLRAHFKTMKKTRENISYSIRDSVMSIWCNNRIIEKYTVNKGVVKKEGALGNL